MLKTVKNENHRSIEKALLKRVEAKTSQRGTKYYAVVVSDKDCELSGNAFNEPAAIEKLEGKVVEFEVKGKDGFLNFEGFREAQGEDPRAYVRCAPLTAEQGLKYVYQSIDQIQNPILRAVTERLIRNNEEAYAFVAGGKSMHHDVIGGLLYHSVCILSAAMQMCRVYKSLNRDLMIAGPILHDVAKVKELVTDDYASTVYTTAGNLFGHLYMGAAMVDEACRELGVDENEEIIMMLKHMILSHHGEQAMGAVRVPAIPEAFMLSQLDNIDARMWMFEHTAEGLEPGETCGTFHKGLQTYVYKPNL